MPDDDARKSAGRRLASDLRTLREEHGLSPDELREALHVPSGLFDAFESGRLMEHPMFNRVYLRSLTRSYADATGTPSAPALSSLGAVLKGDYEEGQLQREIEAHQNERSAEEEKAEEERREREAAEEEARAEKEKREKEAEKESGKEAGAAAAGAAAAETGPAHEEPDWTSQSPTGASHEEAEQREREKEERAQEREQKREERARQQAERQREKEERAARQSEEREQDRASRQQQARSDDDRSARRDRHRRRRGSSSSNAGRWIVGALVIAAIGVGLFFLITSLTGDGTTETQTAQTTTTSDTSASEQSQPQDERPRANLQLGETMNFTVVAQGGPVRDLRVTRDQDVRRPYWIEQGQARVFPANQRIVIEDPPEGTPTLGNVRLVAEGYNYPMDQRDSQGRIVITRDAMQSFADTLRGQAAQIPAQRDTAALFGGGQ